MNLTLDAFPDGLSHWLHDSGSFIQKLKAHGVTNVQVCVQKEGWCRATSSECRELGLSVRAFVWVREVIIHSNNTTWMFARTVIPCVMFRGKERAFKYLRSRSLGSILFKHPHMQRSEFEFFKVKTLWARRSRFILRDKSLLLTEVFFSISWVIIIT